MVGTFVLFLICSSSVASARWNTADWIGSEYTPASAPGNSLWWHQYDEYEPSVQRELQAASKWGLNTVRVFLHSMIFANDSTRLLNSMDRFLAISSKCGIKVGFVFFDDCWNHQGASLDTPCVPEKGKHNGCWMASPQDIERTDVDRFKAYVSTTVQHFRADSRVLWWEEIPRAHTCPHM